jgi:SAM-dependent methyltransferase
MVSPRWIEWRRSVDLDKYDARWEAMAERGESIHGEADAVDRIARAMGGIDHVLDAGCGTGRVAIELARRGYQPVGVDLDPDMVDRARRKAPQLEWHTADLATFDHQQSFDLIVLAGNIPIFCATGAQSGIIANLVRCLRPGGRIVCGWSQESSPGAYRWSSFVADGEHAGLHLVSVWRDWDGHDIEEDSDYAVVTMEK